MEDMGNPFLSLSETRVAKKRQSTRVNMTRIVRKQSGCPPSCGTIAGGGKSWPGVVRAKGFFWLATRPHYVGEISQAGALIRTGKRGLWWASVPKNQWPDHPEWKAAMKPYLDPIWGDRRQEIVFIGCDPMNEQQIRADLDACLVKEKDFSPGSWRDLPDPFPNWDKQAA